MRARPQSKTMTLLEQTAGAVVMIVTLLDIFLTILYARAGTALFSPFVSPRGSGFCFVWARVPSTATAAEFFRSAGR